MTHPLRVVAPLALSFAACAVHAQDEQPWYIGARLGYSHDSNVFRRDNPHVSDNVTSAGILGGFHWRPGRQHLYIDGNADSNRYGTLKDLNNTSHSVTTGLDWQTVEHLAGNLRYASRQNLADYTSIATPAARNIVRGQDATASIRYGFVGDLGIEAGVGRRKADYTLTTENNTTSDVAWIGGRYAGGGQLELGVTARYTKGDTPGFRPLLPLDLTIVPTLGPVEPDKADRKDLDFNVTWQASGLSTLQGTISLTREDHTAPSQPDFSGVTGHVTWLYKPTGKTTIRTSVVRDTGSGTSFLSLSTLGLQGLRFDNNTLNWTVLAEADWEATAKILVTPGLRYIRGTTDTTNGGSFTANTTRLTLAARYLFSRNVTFACNLLRDTGTSIASATVYGCTGEFVWK